MSKVFSHSKLSSFEQCPHKYKLRYIDKIRVDAKSIEALLGSAVHNALEHLYIQKKAGKTPLIDEIINIYIEDWQKNYTPDVIIVKTEFTDKDYFNKGILFLTTYYTKHHPFDDNTLELEKKIFMGMGDQGHQIIGFIDRLVHNQENDSYEVHDYKTANSLPTQQQADKDRQLALYALAIKELYGMEKDVLLVWHYLAHDTKITSKRTNEQLSQLKREIIELIAKIESATQFPPNKSILCNWCEYKKMCPAHQQNHNYYKQTTL